MRILTSCVVKIFEDGMATEFRAFGLSDWIRRTPRDVLLKNFTVTEEMIANLPSDGESPTPTLHCFSMVN